MCWCMVWWLLFGIGATVLVVANATRFSVRVGFGFLWWRGLSRMGGDANIWFFCFWCTFGAVCLGL
jgi:hypothetical protein